MMMNIGIRPAFEEHVEQHDIERAEHADHHRFEHQERDHVFPHAGLDRIPAGQDAQRHQEGGQDDEQHRNAVHAHRVGEHRAWKVDAFHHLEPGIAYVEARPDQQRHHEGRGRPRRAT
jgi:hypothetical protein